MCLAEVAKDLIPNHNSWACYAFNENLYIVKDFTEIYGMRTKSRIGGLGSGLKTYLPDALRLAANRLKTARCWQAGFPPSLRFAATRLSTSTPRTRLLSTANSYERSTMTRSASGRFAAVAR